MKYELLWHSEKDNTFYSNYATSKKELKEKLDYFVNVKGLKLNDTDKFDNIQVSKVLKNGKRLIMSENEVLNEVN